jgi:hypothetical protein
LLDLFRDLVDGVGLDLRHAHRLSQTQRGPFA